MGFAHSDQSSSLCGHGELRSEKRSGRVESKRHAINESGRMLAK
jgi:hypothetical protein